MNPAPLGTRLPKNYIDNSMDEILSLRASGFSSYLLAMSVRKVGGRLEIPMLMGLPMGPVAFVGVDGLLW